MTNQERYGMSIILEIKVTPSSGRQRIVVDSSGMRIKVYLKSPPEDGKANSELIDLLAKTVGCPKMKIDILSGAASRTKRVKIDLPLTREELLSRLGFALQMSLIG